MLRIYTRFAALAVLVSVLLIIVASNLIGLSGDTLLYVSNYDPSGSDWSLMDAASRLSYRLLRDAVWLTWSPDGSRLAFMREINQRTTPHTLDLDTGLVQRFNTDIAWIARPPVWSPDGTRLLLIDYGYPVAPLFMLHLDDGRVENLNILSGDDFGWTPDGEGVYFNERGETLLLNLRTRAVTPFLAGVNPQWSPDGRWIAFERVNLAQSTSWITILDTTTGESRIVPIPAENVLLHSWSPDGRWLITTRMSERPSGWQRRALYLVDPVTLDGRDLSDVNIYCRVEWAPDGRLSFTDQQGWLWALDVESGERTLLFIGQADSCTASAWRPRKE